MLNGYLFSLAYMAIYFLLDKRRVPRLQRFAEEHGFRFQDAIGDAELELSESNFYKGGQLRNIITGAIDGKAFIYFEQVVSYTERESIIAFEISSGIFTPPKPPLFGLLTERNRRFGFFWWEGYRVALNEMDIFLNQGLRAFRAATAQKVQPSPPTILSSR